jgi:hypothetical protein
VPILYEDYTFSPERVKDTEQTLTIFLQAKLTCPVCGETFTDPALYEEHMKTKHPLQWYFWYAPYGKPLLAFTGVAVGGVLLIGLSKAFAPKR